MFQEPGSSALALSCDDNSISGFMPCWSRVGKAELWTEEECHFPFLITVTGAIVPEFKLVNRKLLAL
jgi:hypothetical protein